MAQEKQKSDEEPKKKRGKGSSIVSGAIAAGAIAAAAGLYALTGNKLGENQEPGKPAAGEITKKLDAGVIREIVGARVRAATAINASNAVELARQGNIQAAEFIDDEYRKAGGTFFENVKRIADVEETAGSNHGDIFEKGIEGLIEETEKAQKKVLEEFGISEEEYKVISNAVGFRKNISKIDNPPEYSENNPHWQADPAERACDSAMTILDRMASYDPFDPTFLALIKMDKATLQARVLQMIETSKAFWDLPFPQPQELENRLRQAYEIE